MYKRQEPDFSTLRITRLWNSTMPKQKDYATITILLVIITRWTTSAISVSYTHLSTMFGDVNEKVGTIAAEVGKTPQGWNANIFNMIQNLSENVIVPIAGPPIIFWLINCLIIFFIISSTNYKRY